MSEAKTADTEAKKSPKRAARVESTFADKWEPAEGEEISGVYLGYEDAQGRSEDSFRAYQIMTDAGKRVSMAGAHLDSILPQVPKGAYVWVAFLGKRKMRRGDMALFQVDVEDGVKLIPALK